MSFNIDRLIYQIEDLNRQNWLDSAPLAKCRQKQKTERQQIINQLKDTIVANEAALHYEKVAKELLHLEYKAKKIGLDIQSLHHFILAHTKAEFLDLVQLHEHDKAIELPKCWLVKESPYFKSLLETAFKEKQAKKIDLQEDSPEGAELLFHYLMKGEIQPTLANVFALIEISNKYCLDELKAQCDHYLNTQLNQEDFFCHLDAWVELCLVTSLPSLKSRLEQVFIKQLSLYAKTPDSIPIQERIKSLGKACSSLHLHFMVYPLTTDHLLFVLHSCPNLIDLTLSEFFLPHSCITSLPKTIRHLSLQDCQVDSPDYPSYLPSSLTHLTLKNCTPNTVKSLEIYAHLLKDIKFDFD